jgi:hypothetical protein
MQGVVRKVSMVAIIALLSTWNAGLASAQDPVLDQPFAGSVVVTGQAEPGSGPITILNTSYTVPASIGSRNSMDADGYFAVTLSPPPFEGNTIVARDAQGRESAVMTALSRGP